MSVTRGINGRSRFNAPMAAIVAAASIATALGAAPAASADRDGGMVKCFIAHGIADSAAITVGDWQVGKPLFDPPGGIDRDNWFRTYAVCAFIVHRTNIF